MKVWRLVAGILSCVLFGFVSMQSCAAGLSNALQENGEVSGSAGLLVAIFMLSGGIVSIATRKSSGKGASIALMIIFGLASLLAFSNSGSFTDLKVWGSWCLINAVLAVVAMLKSKKAIS